MRKIDLDQLKKAVFLHDLGKILNWEGYLHSLDGGRVLSHCGFNNEVVAAALYHHKRTLQDIMEAISNNKKRCSGLPKPNEYRYVVKLCRLADRLVSGLDRLIRGGEQRKQPVVLRNPLTHLPLNQELTQFRNMLELRDNIVKARFMDNTSIVQLNNDDEVFKLDEYLCKTDLLKPLVEHKDDEFNELYESLRESSAWRKLTLYYIPQDTRPPSDTLALWYHLQLSSALAPLFPLEGLLTWKSIDNELDRFLKEPRRIKIGLLYVKIRGMDEFFATSYRLPDFEGSQIILRGIRKAIRNKLLSVRIESQIIKDMTADSQLDVQLDDSDLPFIWQDSFLYEGHDDFLIIFPLREMSELKDWKYIHAVNDNDPFFGKVTTALDTEEVLKQAVTHLLKDLKFKAVLTGEDPAVLLRNGGIIAEEMKEFVSIDFTARCFAGFQTGEELTPFYGVIWNDMRREVNARPLEQRGREVNVYIGDLCDAGRRNPASSGLFNRVVPKKRKLIWRSESEEEADKLCHLCLVRRCLGTGTRLDRIAKGGEIALIKGNVNRTAWYIGGVTELPTVKGSVYARVWQREICTPISDESLEQGKRLSPERILERFEKQSSWAKGSSQHPLVKPQIDLPSLGIRGIELPELKDFINRQEDSNPFKALCLTCLFYNPTVKKWQSMDDKLRDSYKKANVYQVKKWRSEAVKRLKDALNKLAESQITQLPKKFPNPWAPFPLDEDMEKVIEYLFSGSPNFSTRAAGQPDLPTPSRTMTVSWLIDRAVRKAEEIAEQKELTKCIYAEGDEFLVVCNAQDAPDLADEIFKEGVGLLNSLPPESVEKLERFFPATLAMGVVVAKQKFPMYHLLELADRMLRSAKYQAGEERGYNTNAIDLVDVRGGVDEEYLTGERWRARWLSQRPLTLSQFTRLYGDAQKIEKSELAKRQLQLLLTVMSHLEEQDREDKLMAAASYALKQEISETEEDMKNIWRRIRESCEEGYYQDLVALWKIIRRKEGA